MSELRKIVSTRRIQYERAPNARAADYYFEDILECGHVLTRSAHMVPTKRRHCVHCSRTAREQMQQPVNSKSIDA